MIPFDDISKHWRHYFQMTTITKQFNTINHPTLSVPCGDIDCLPVKLMIVGHDYDEQTVLNVDYTYELLCSPVSITSIDWWWTVHCYHVKMRSMVPKYSRYTLPCSPTTSRFVASKVVFVCKSRILEKHAIIDHITTKSDSTYIYVILMH